MEERLKIVNNILAISDENNNPFDIKNIKLEFSCNKYSSKKNSIYHITLNSNTSHPKHLSKRDKYNIKYKCVTCDGVHIVGTTQFIRKVNKCSYRCNLCVNKEESKRSYVQQSSNHEMITEEKPKTSLELRIDSIKAFEEYDDEFKEDYFKAHLTDDDYMRISKNLISIQNGKYLTKDLDFWSIFKTNNQMLFTSIFYDKTNDIIIKGNQPILKCDNCDSIWRAKVLEKFKNCYRILCKDCTLCNKTFKIRNMQNCIKEKVLYQSQLEYKFVTWCNNSGIVVKNGPIIEYLFEGKIRKYKVDFQINEVLIEIKDNHVWHNMQVQSGKWKAKEDSVKEEIKQGIYKDYYLITPKNWVQYLNKIKELNKI